MFKVRTLNDSQQSQSYDPDYWNVWTGNENSEVDWNIIAKDWQERVDN